MEENRNLLILGIFAIVLLFLFSSFGMGGYGMMGFGMGFGLIFMILFWGILIWIIFALIKTFQPNEEDPLILLKKRYASGKIPKKQYEKMKKELKW